MQSSLAPRLKTPSGVRAARAGRMLTRAVFLGVVVGAIGTLGCAEQRAPVNRVQPNALDKSFFVGKDLQDPSDDPEFYARGTVVDVGYGAAQDGLFTSTYAQPVTRIKWTIQEDLLIGRLTYQRIANSDGKGAGPASEDGQVAYAYPIQSHFDIKRDYNPTTGEQTNVIVENTTDRPWYQREYMRVDWSRNLNVDAFDFDTLSLMGIYGGVSYSPLAYYVNDPDSPDAPHFNVEAGYFDVTNKAFAQPQLIDLSGLGWGVNKFPACYLDNDFFQGSAPAGNCNPVELTLRQSFRRVEVSDYEPVDWDGYQFVAFGIFTNDRYGYARNYGMTDTDWHRFASRYNIWDKSHAYVAAKGNTCPDGWTPSIDQNGLVDYAGQCVVSCFVPDKTLVGQDPNRDLADESGNATPDGTADECEAVTAVYGPGSTCDQFKQKCTHPYAKRTAKPIVSHMSKGSNPLYYERTKWAAQEWDVAMSMAVQTAAYAECERTTKTADGSKLETNAATVQSTCSALYPVIVQQEKSNVDAVQLTTEVNRCRVIGVPLGQAGKTPWSKDIEASCEAIADQVGGARGYEAGVIAIAKMQPMLTLCHGPVEAEDSPLCKADVQAKDPISGDTREVLAEGEAATCNANWALPVPDATLKAKCDNAFYTRMGDLRFHKVNLITEPQTPSPWGIMVDADDPTTGEKVEASINVWTHVNELAAQQMVDISRYIKGELTTADVTDGTYVQDWAAAADAKGHNGSGIMDKATLTSKIEGAANAANWDGQKFHVGQSGLPPEAYAKAWQIKQDMRNVIATAGAPTTSQAFYDARRNAAIGTQTEAGLLTAPMLEAGGYSPDTPQSGAVAQNASILQGSNPNINRQYQQAKQMALAARGACMIMDDEAPEPNNLAAIADILERKFEGVTGPDGNPWGKFGSEKDSKGNCDATCATRELARGDAMRAFIAQRYQYGVIIHEMGHSIGLRHNFVSSANAWGYRPQYWQLRTDDGNNTTECTDVSTNKGVDCVGPRYYDPVNTNEKNNLIWMFMQSSVMDYPGETTQDMLGLGAYDFAAARMFYGQVESVHTDPTYAAKKPRSVGMLDITDNFGGIVGITYTSGKADPAMFSALDTIHYSQLQKNYALIQNCKKIPDINAFKPTWWDANWEKQYGTWDPLLDGLSVQQSNGDYTRCDDQPGDYMPYQQMHFPTTAELGGVGAAYQGGPAIDRFERTRVPYAFATDTWADLGNLSVYRHDNGADPYELFDFFISEPETRHIFDNYRRNRTTFSVRAQSNRILERYMTKMRDAAKGLTLQYNFIKNLAETGQFLSNGAIVDFDQGGWVDTADLLWKDDLLASGMAFDHFARQLMRPEIGPHNVVNGLLTANDNGTGTVNIPNGATGLFDQVAFGGKLIENQLSSTHGTEYDPSYVIDTGSYYDKVNAPYLLTESVDNFISDTRIDYVDARYRAVSVADLFPDAYRRLLANGLTGDEALKGPVIAASASGAPLLTATGGFPANGIGWTSWITDTPTNCFPGSTGIICSSFQCDGGVCAPASFGGAITMHPFDNQMAPATTIPVDPQVGYEEQKFLIAQTLLYLPENQKQNWLNLLGIWELGADTDPGFTNRIELHLPDGKVYIARTYGTETIHGKTVQRGHRRPHARVRQRTSGMQAAYEGATVNGSTASWWQPTIGASGNAIVKFTGALEPIPNPNCTCGRRLGLRLLAERVLREAAGLRDPSRSSCASRCTTSAWPTRR